MGKLMREQVKALEQIGEERLFDRILGGETVRSLAADLGIGWRTWYKFIDSAPGRRQRYDETLRDAGHAYAARAVETAQNATPETVNVARLQVDTDKWIAAKLNSQYDIRQKDISVTLKVEDLHAQVAAMIAQEVEADIIEGVAEELDDVEALEGRTDGDDDGWA